MEKKGKEAKAKVLWKLFISTLYLSAFTSLLTKVFTENNNSKHEKIPIKHK